MEVGQTAGSQGSPGSNLLLARPAGHYSSSLALHGGNKALLATASIPPPQDPPTPSLILRSGEITRFDADTVPFFSLVSTRLSLLASWVISSLQLRRFSLSLSLAVASLTVAKLISPTNGKLEFGRMWHLKCVKRENKQIKHFISGLWQFVFVFWAVMKSLCFLCMLQLDLYSSSC